MCSVLSLCCLLLALAPTAPPPSLADAPKVEALTLGKLLAASAWPRRALAAARLERYGDAATTAMLVDLLDDPAWQVRCFAVRSLARRGEPLPAGRLNDEAHPRVVRTALRHRYHLDPARLANGVEQLSQAPTMDERLLAVEIGGASGDDALVERATDLVRTIILRMDRADAGTLSPRLARVTGAPRLGKPHRWHRWLRQAGRDFRARPGFAIPPGTTPLEPGPLAQLDPERFGALEVYIERLETRSIDLAIALDCTASMGGELLAAQSGLDDLVTFVGDLVPSLRMGLVAYRDRRDRFVTRSLPLTEDRGVVRTALWSLEAEGGGDSAEAVLDALRAVYTGLDWSSTRTGVVVLVGDAPPHPGYGAACVDLARRAALIGVTTHVIEAEGEPVPHFDAIAEAGGGLRVDLDDDTVLVAEIAGLTVGGGFSAEFIAFFRDYADLCR